MSIFSPRPSRAETVVDFSDIVADEDRLNPSPTLYELDEILEALKPFDRMNVRLTRTQLKWTAKAARKFLGINYQHPGQQGRK